ncbi:MAG: hypothetical protein ACE5FO_11425 [Parvularculaceae bacterium]
MGAIDSRTVRRRALKRTIALAAALGLIAGEAAAQISSPTAPLRMRSSFLGYSASVNPRVAYSDNLNLVRDEIKDDDVVLSNLLTGGLIVSNDRVTAIFSGDLDLSYFTDRTNLVVNQDVGGVGTATVADNLLFVDFAAGSSRQLVGDNGRFSANINAGRDQRANVHSYSASPYFYRKFSNFSTGELRYRFSQVFIDDSDAAANPIRGGNLLNDSTSHEALAKFDSAGMFDRVKITLSAYGNHTEEDGSDIIPSFEYEQGTLLGEGEFALNRTFSLTGAGGYDDVETDALPGIFDDEALSGAFWRAGFAASPSRRTRVKIEYGERYDDEFIEAELRYEMNRNFVLSGGASRRFRTRAQSVSSQFRGLQRDILDFADRLREGESLSPEAVVRSATQFGGRSINAQTTGIGVSETAHAQLTGVFSRLEVAARVRYEDTDFGFRKFEVLSGTLNARQSVSRRLMVYGDMFYRRVDSFFDPASCIQNPTLFGFDINDPLFDATASCTGLVARNGRTHTVGGSAGAGYQIYKNVSVFGEYSHTERFSEIPLLEYGENVVVAGLTLSF